MQNGPVNPSREPRQWVLLLHQLPATAANARMRVWRRLQQLAAMPLRGSAYVLPLTPQALEDFEWLRAEIVSLGGTASLFVGAPVDAALEEEMVERFRQARSDAYRALRTEIRAASRRLGGKHRGKSSEASLARTTQLLRRRFTAAAEGDHFGGAERDAVASELSALEQRVLGRAQAPAAAPTTPALFDARTWVTRPRPGVDRMSSAWLIRTFIDPRARFVFADHAQADQVAFDMFEGEFTHQGDACTFEVLVRRFGLGDPAVRHIATIVHDLDLKDEKHNTAETHTIGLLVDGIQQSHLNDERALETGIGVFAALYRSLATGAGAQRARQRPSTTRPPRAATKRKRR
jgi:hypothetical protein